MSSGTRRTMLIGGERGGKSTFLGGLALEMKRGSDVVARSSDSWWQAAKGLLTGEVDDSLNGSYRVTHGRDDIFEGDDTAVIDRMRSGIYPQKTAREETYIIEFEINDDLDWSPTIEMSVMDIPGEAQREAIQDLLADDYEADEVRETFEDTGVSSARGSIEERIENGEPINQAEWKWAFIYKYIRSDRIIFLVNLHKAIRSDDLDISLEPELLEKASTDRNCLLLVTAVDLLGYDPASFSVGPLSGGGLSSANFDDDLAAEISPDQGQLSPATGDEVMALVNAARVNGMDMFGVSVPAGSQPNSIEQDGGRPVLKGFDNVGEWFKR